MGKNDCTTVTNQCSPKLPKLDEPSKLFLKLLFLKKLLKKKNKFVTYF